MSRLLIEQGYQTMTQLVLLAGATGMLGRRIAYCLTREPDARVRLLLRPGTMADAGKAKALAPIVERGAKIVFGDLGNPASLERAVTGVEVVVSAVQGASPVMIDGQVALAEAAQRAGVRRILPSDFALDLFRTPPGEHRLYDMRRQADAAIAALSLEHINVLNGAFMDLFVDGAGRMIDLHHATARFWGTGDELFETTSVEDTARMTARAAVDRTLGSGKFAFAGDILSMEAVVAAVEAATGRSFERRLLGSLDELRRTIAEARRDDPSGMGAEILTYQLFMADGRAGLTNLQTTRYPDIHLAPFAEFARMALGIGVSS
jgi:uncharacterized protein YbjT (DUF2867 family)